MKASPFPDDVLQTETYAPLLCLIADRESSLGRLAAGQLENEGFEVRRLSHGADVVKRVHQIQPSLVIIETTRSWERSLGVCCGIRSVPVILLAARASEEERILGLESGADDYITESSSGRELAARVRAVLRRSARRELSSWTAHILPRTLHSLMGTHSPRMKTGDIEIDPATMTISVRGAEIVTTNLEFRLLYYLAHNQARVFTRDQLLEAVWGPQNNVELRSVDACIRRLRRKIEPDPLRPTYLKTIWGAGYCLQAA